VPKHLGTEINTKTVEVDGRTDTVGSCLMIIQESGPKLAQIEILDTSGTEQFMSLSIHLMKVITSNYQVLIPLLKISVEPWCHISVQVCAGDWHGG